MKAKRRILSVVIALVMLIGALPEMSLMVKAYGGEPGKSTEAGSNKGRVVVDGTVIKYENYGLFQVMSDDGQTTTACLSGKMRMLFIRVMPGDRVQVEYMPDNMKGRIIYRYRNK